MKTTKIIILILIILVFLASLYFRNDILKLYNNLNKGIQDFKKTDVGSVINEVAKDVLNPPPLKIKGGSNQAVLTKSGIIKETNLQRQNNGLPILSENLKLDQAALAKANDMFLNQYFEHVSPLGVDPGKLVLNYGYKYIIAGENLILGNFASEKELVQAWMNSPGHRANILNKRFTEIGVAVLKGNFKGEQVWIGVQEFGLPLSTCKEPSQTLKDDINNKKSRLDQMSQNIDSIKNEIENANSRNPQYNELVDSYNKLVLQYQSLADAVKNLISQYNSQVNIFNQCVKGV